VARGQLLLLPCVHSQLVCLDQQLKPRANPAHKIPLHSCHSPVMGMLVPLTLASCYSPWLPLKSLFVCLIANEQNTTAYFLLCLKIFSWGCFLQRFFSPAHDKGQLAARSERFTSEADPTERKSFAQNWVTKRGYESVSSSHAAEHAGTWGGRLTDLATLISIPPNCWETLQESCEVESTFFLLKMRSRQPTQFPQLYWAVPQQ